MSAFFLLFIVVSAAFFRENCHFYTEKWIHLFPFLICWISTCCILPFFLGRESVRFSTRFYRFLYEVLMLFRRVFLLVFLMCDIFFFLIFLSLFILCNNKCFSIKPFGFVSLLFPFHQISFSYILRASLNIVQKKLIKLLRGKLKHTLSILLSFFPSDMFFSLAPSFSHT